MLKQVLPNSAQQNIWSPARRICIMMLGLKGLNLWLAAGQGVACCTRRESYGELNKGYFYSF